MKIQLQSLRVINCGPLRDVCIHFNADGDSPVTLLAGANGSGKTTVLELIFATLALLLPGGENHDFGRLIHADTVQLDLILDDRKLSIISGRQHLDGRVPPDSAGYMRIVAGIRPYYTRDITGSGEDIWQRIGNEIRYSVHAKNIETFGFVEPNDVRHKVPFPCILYFPHNRSLVPLEGSQIQREDIEYQWTYRYNDVRTFRGSLDSYLVWLDYAEPSVFAEAIEFLDLLNFDGKTFGVRRRDLKAVVTTSDGKTHYMEELSSGEQNILIMLLELRRRLIPHSIVLIDEIENSLHPAFQHRIVNGLKRLQEMIPFQLIVSSHSLTILEAFGTQSARILTQF